MLFRGDYEEKRDFARMGVECAATFCIEGDSTIHHATATDLSATGLQLNCADNITVGSIVMVELTPSEAIVPPLKAKAEVVRCIENGSGAYQLGMKVIEMLPGL